MRLGSAGERELRSGEISGADRGLRRQWGELVSHPESAVATGVAALHGGAPGDSPQRPRFPADADLLPPEPDGDQRAGAERLLDLAPRHPPGLPGAARWRVRPGPCRRRLDWRAP